MTEEENSHSDLSPSTGEEGEGQQETIPLHVESLIFASDRPLTSAEITELINNTFGFMEDKIVPEQIDASLKGIAEKYSAASYPFEVVQSGGGWQFLTKKDYHKTVAQLNGEKFLKRLSGASLETLAIIAYKQPITKGEIESIRGVSSDYSVQKLLEKELIVISGRNEALPGHPLVYNTSKNFMDYFGINSPEDLPKIREVLANIAVAPTIVNGTEAPEEGEEQPAALAVSDEGELIVNNQPHSDDTEANNNKGTEEVAAEITNTMATNNNTDPIPTEAEKASKDPATAADSSNNDENVPDAEAAALKAVDETGTDVEDELGEEKQDANTDEEPGEDRPE